MRLARGASECVGCGYCCLAAPCGASDCFVLRRWDRPCRFLSWDGQRYRCERAAELERDLAIGAGCCSPLNTWRQDVRRRC